VAAAADVVESHEPATGSVLGSVPRTAPEDVARAVTDSAAVQPLWASLRVDDRARYLRRAAQAVIDEFDDVVELIVREQGRPRAEAVHMEVLPGIETLLWLAERGVDALKDQRIGLSPTFFLAKRARVTHAPLGVIAVITPAADPFAQPLGDVAIALLAGNGVVLKPSPSVPLCGERIGRAFARAGLPEGLLRVVHGGSATGGALVDAPVDQVRFTGSADVGRSVSEACARALKPCTLALSGRDPMLVLPDADVDHAVHGGAWGAFANAGQAGGSIERAYVARTAFPRFLAGVVEAARSLPVGDPRDDGTAVGPLTTEAHARRVAELVEGAVAAGATLHCGGPRQGRWVEPAVLTDVPPNSPLMLEEVPGPVLVVVAVDSLEEAIALANATEVGLGASVWTRDREAGKRVARALQVGMVWMNDHQVSAMAPQLPWGGVKDSGLGRVRGEAALLECVTDKVVTWDPPGFRPLWWHPYDTTSVRGGQALAWMRSVRDRDRSRAWRTRSLSVARLAARTVTRGRSRG
jgi:succinate-semialdehyde dehydrogenase/glutarate-semialdehyde dehydrogenase